MASCSSALSEEQVQCSICLEVLTEPVSIPCGHNFCKVCIGNYWDTTDLCQCPLCKTTFYRRPELHVNRTLRDVVENIKKTKIRNEGESPAVPGEVPCDFCTGTKLKAVKSCLVCLASYCETHLESHLRGALRRHQLVLPVDNLEDRMCKKHDKLLELFCRKDQTCVCLMCMNTDHQAHNAVPLAEECREIKTKLGKMMADIDQMMTTRSMKVEEIKLSVESSKRDVEREVSSSVEVFTALVSSIERSQAELIRVLEEKHKAVEKRAEGFTKDLEQELTELKKRRSELEQLEQSEDPLHFLQTFPSLNTTPHAKDWSQISVQSGLRVGTVWRAVSQLEDTLMQDIKKLCDAELKRIQQYEVGVTLDADTAHPNLILSEDGKQVRHGDTHLDRLDEWANVLGKQGFSSGRFYYEVHVGGKTEWELGVAKQSANRKGETTLARSSSDWHSSVQSRLYSVRVRVRTESESELFHQLSEPPQFSSSCPQTTLGPKNGHWTICLKKGDGYKALDDSAVALSLREKPTKVGVFVDYEEGQVSFYNVEAKSHIYTYTGCIFTEKIYPVLCPGLNNGGENSAPLIINDDLMIDLDVPRLPVYRGLASGDGERGSRSMARGYVIGGQGGLQLVHSNWERGSRSMGRAGYGGRGRNADITLQQKRILLDRLFKERRY